MSDNDSTISSPPPTGIKSPSYSQPALDAYLAKNEIKVFPPGYSGLQHMSVGQLHKKKKDDFKRTPAELRRTNGTDH